MVSKDTLNFAAKDLLKKIGKEKTSREYCNQETIFRQGDAADAMFYIQDGNVKVTVTSRRAKGSSRDPPARRLFWWALSREAISEDVHRHGNSPVHYCPSQEKNDSANNAARAWLCKAGYLLSPLSHCPNRGKLCGSDPAFQRKATRADSLAASPFWKSI